MFDDSYASNSGRLKSKMARPKPVYLWTTNDVLKWYRRHCSEYPQYLELFSKVYHWQYSTFTLEMINLKVLGKNISILPVFQNFTDLVAAKTNCH